MRSIKHTQQHCSISLGKVAGLASGTGGLGTALGIGAAGLDFFSAKSLQNDSQSFTREMMRSKHQWEVNDLRSAGLNPILSAHGSGSMGGSGIASAGNPGSKGVSTALQAMLLTKQMGLLQQQTRKTQFEADNNQISAGFKQWALANGINPLMETAANFSRYLQDSHSARALKNKSYDHGKPPWIKADELAKKYPATERARKTRERLLNRNRKSSRKRSLRGHPIN